MERFVAAIDQGTSSTRVVVYNSDMRPVRTAQRALVSRAPHPGWLEMEGRDILASVDACLAEAVADFPGHIACVGITNQRETTIALDVETGEHLSAAILWSDTRTAGVCAEWRARQGAERVTAVTGLPISPYFSASKMAWLLQHEPRVQQAKSAGRLAFATVDAFVLHHLAGGRLATDGSNASRTLLMDLEKLHYDQDTMTFCGLQGCALPAILPSVGQFGTIRSGPLAGVPITAMLGDQQAALLGQGCLEPGDSKATFGTGCFLLQHAGFQRPAQSSVGGLVATVAVQSSAHEATYALEGSVAAAGSVVTWLRDEMKLIASYKALDEEAAKVGDCGGVTVVPAFTGLLAPYWRSDARGTVLGMSLGTTRAHVVRACLAGIAQTVADVMEAMDNANHLNPEALRVDGGLAESKVLMQLVADATGRQVWLRDDKEATALGAALAAGAGAGLWQLHEKTKALAVHWTKVMPSASAEERQIMRDNWKQAVPKSYT